MWRRRVGLREVVVVGVVVLGKSSRLVKVPVSRRGLIEKHLCGIRISVSIM